MVWGPVWPAKGKMPETGGQGPVVAVVVGVGVVVVAKAQLVANCTKQRPPGWGGEWPSACRTAHALGLVPARQKAAHWTPPP